MYAGWTRAGTSITVLLVVGHILSACVVVLLTLGSFDVPGSRLTKKTKAEEVIHSVGCVEMR